MRYIGIIITFAFTMVVSIVKAQNEEPYSLLFHDTGEYEVNPENLMQQGDGDFVINTLLFAPDPNPHNPGTILGNLVYKISLESLTITDTLVVADTFPSYYLFARDPRGEGNIRVGIAYNEDNDSSYLNISRFPDNDLGINHDEDVMVPLCEGYAFNEYNGHMVNQGSLMMKYYLPSPEGGYECHIVSFDTEGTIIRDAVLPSDQIFTNKLRLFKETPSQYYHWKGFSNDNLVVFVLDSIFHPKYSSMINKILREEVVNQYQTFYEHLGFNTDTEVIPAGGDDILVAARYTADTNFDPLTAQHGVAVAKYDVRTMQQKGYVAFNDFPAVGVNDGRCMGLKMMSDGTVYFLYRERGYPDESVMAVKMDVNLNVEWKRFWKTDNVYLPSFLLFPILYQDGGEEKGVVWIGAAEETDTDKLGISLFMLNHDGTVSTSDNAIEVRPYLFYPNPAQDLLHFQFSPDVKPTQVELYDLQGRLVRAQGDAFDSLDLGMLPAGTYTLRITMEDGQVFSDKVVKE